MTQLEVSPADIDTIVGESESHAKCCKERAFLCGAEWHPEAGQVEGDEDFDCEACMATLVEMHCPTPRSYHWHCPIRPGRPICPIGPES